MIEYKTERVLPQLENSILSVNATFGWQLISSQEVYNETTGISGVNVKSYGAFMQGFTGQDGKISVNTYTNVTHFISMRFGRDTAMPEYDRICSLENQFYASVNMPKPKKPVTLTAVCVIAMLIVLISIFNAVAQNIMPNLWETMVCIVIPVMLIPPTIIFWRSYKKDMVQFEEVKRRGADALMQARQIMNGRHYDVQESTPSDGQESISQAG